jgi:hypothetical protein
MIDGRFVHDSGRHGPVSRRSRQVSPAMKREVGPPMKRENPTPGKAFWVLSSDEMQMTRPVAHASLLDWNPLIYREPGSRFMSGFSVHRWIFLRFIGGSCSTDAPALGSTLMGRFCGVSE